MEYNNQNETIGMETTSEDETFKKTASGILRIAWFLLLSITLLLVVANIIAYYSFEFSNYWFEWPVSYLLGAIINIINFNILKLALSNPNYVPKSSKVSNNYFIRMVLYAATCFIALKVKVFNIVPVIIGFFTIRVAIFIYTLKNRG